MLSYKSYTLSYMFDKTRKRLEKIEKPPTHLNPLPSAAPDPLAGHHPLAGHQDLPQYYVEVETIFCGLQMSQMSCIERTLLQTMLKMLKKVNTNNVEKTRKKISPQTPDRPFPR